VSQLIAHEMSRVTDGRNGESSDIASDEGAPFQRQIVGAQELPDIQVPGQEFSLRTVLRFVKNAIGLGDTTMSITISVDGKSLMSDILVVGGPYDGVREGVRLPMESIAAFLRSTAVHAVAAAQPLSYAAYVAVTDPKQCPPAVACSVDEAERVLSRLLADSHAADDAGAHLALSAVTLKRGDYAGALRHCEAALRSMPPSAGPTSTARMRWTA
jgi:hypothetical protein